MRLQSLELLAAAAIILGTPSYSEVAGAEMAQVDRLTTGPSYVSDYSAAHDHQLPQAIKTTEGEERAPLPRGLPSSLEAFASDVGWLTLGKSPAIPDEAPAKKVLARLNPFGDSPSSSNAQGLKERNDRVKMRLSERPEGLRDMVNPTQIFGTKQASGSPKMLAADVMQDPVMKVITKAIKRAQKISVTFHSSTLNSLASLLKQWNAKYLERNTLLDVFLWHYKSARNLELALSVAKTDAESKLGVEMLESAISIRRMTEGHLIGAAGIDFQKPSGMMGDMTSKHLNAPDEHLALHHGKIKYKTKYQNKLDLKDRLQEKNIHDTGLVGGTEEKREKALSWKGTPNTRIKELVRLGITDPSKQVENLLDQYGSEAKLAEALSAAMMLHNPGRIKTMLIEAQKALVERWLRKVKEELGKGTLENGEDMDYVYDLLKLSKYAKAGFTNVAMDTFRAYGFARNRHYPTQIDVESYLRQKTLEAGGNPASKRQRTG